MDKELLQKYGPKKYTPKITDEEFKRRWNDTFDRYNKVIEDEKKWRKDYSKELGERLKELEKRKAAADDLLDKINKNKWEKPKTYTPSRGLPDPIRKPLTPKNVVNTSKQAQNTGERIQFFERMRGNRDGSYYSHDENRTRRNRAFYPTNVSNNLGSVWNEDKPYNWNA